MGKSWFYLTLWNGIPPEFTSEVDAKIASADYAAIQIKKETSTQSKIVAVAAFVANVIDRESIGAEIIKNTEVVWYVGG